MDLDALLEGKGLADILNRMDRAEKVYEYENRVLTDYITTKNQVHDLWDLLVLKNGSGHVHHIHRSFVHGELYNTYTLRPSHGMGTVRMYNSCQSGCSFQATVSDVMQDMVKIRLIDDETGNRP